MKIINLLFILAKNDQEIKIHFISHTIIRIIKQRKQQWDFLWKKILQKILTSGHLYDLSY